MSAFYLGDSVYAEWRRGQSGELVLKLTTNNGYQDDPRNVIILNGEVLDALMKFCLWQKGVSL
jgi:hypothetical protein